MQEKKSSKGNLDKRRVTFLLIGFVIVFGLVYVCFELFATQPKELGMLPEVTIVEIIENVPVTDPPQTPPPPVAQQDFVLDIVPDTKIIFDSLPIFDDFDPNEAVPTYEPVPLVEEQYDDAPQPVWKVDETPEPNGGLDALYIYLKSNLKYPEIPRNNGIQGQVLLEFVIEKDGSINNVKVVNGVYPDLDQEALRVVKSMPKWKPGKQMGKPVRCSYQLPIRFILN